jgi:Holliday junction resolvase RusA-like endonuclease
MIDPQKTQIQTPLYDLYFPGQPQGRKSHRTRTVKGGRTAKPCFVRYDPSSTEKSRLRRFLELSEQIPEKPVEVALRLEFLFEMERPKYHYDSKGRVKLRFERAKHTKKPDCSNMVKLVEDAFNGILWKDDSYITQIFAAKYYSSHPGIILRAFFADAV